MRSRREFLKTVGSSLIGTRVCAISLSETAFEVDRSALAEQVLALAKKLGATYADVRIETSRTQSVSLRDRTGSGGGEGESRGINEKSRW